MSRPQADTVTVGELRILFDRAWEAPATEERDLQLRLIATIDVLGKRLESIEKRAIARGRDAYDLRRALIAEWMDDPDVLGNLMRQVDTLREGFGDIEELADVHDALKPSATGELGVPSSEKGSYADESVGAAPATSGASAIQFRDLDEATLVKELEESAPQLRAALEAFERAKRVTQKLLKMEVTI